MRAPLPVVACVLAMLAMLAACGRSQDATQAEPSAPADAPPAGPDFSRPLNLLGVEPFWSLRIRPEGLTFSTPAAKDLTAPNAGPQVEPNRAVWTATGSDGAPLAATLTAVVCQDGMSDLTYPFTAQVQAAGRTWTGCAAYADAMPREGGTQP